MKILVSGSTGLLGAALVPTLTRASHQVVRLVRSRPPAGESAVVWDPSQDTLDPRALEGVDAIVHLAGESIAHGRWTTAKKRKIRSSRVDGTMRLCNALARMKRRPIVLVAASAIGFYGDRGDEQLDEQSPPGTGFLPEVCQEWEEATRPAVDAGIRVVSMRIGPVLAPEGGMLARILPIFRCGLGGPVGSGRQYLSWITREDLVRATVHVLQSSDLSGPVNLVSPHPVTNLDFTKTLARVLRRPAILPAPALVLRIVLGEMADGLLLASARALPQRLLQSGFEFADPHLEPALHRMLQR